MISNQENGSSLDSETNSFHINNDTQIMTKAIDILIIPDLLDFIDFDILLNYRLISKVVACSMKDDMFGAQYWRAMCFSFAAFYGLYVPALQTLDVHSYRRYFLQVLWESRFKWPQSKNISSMNSKSHDFKIRVSCRFRPGERCHNNIYLPLHQFLKVKRQERAKSVTNHTDNDTDTDTDRQNSSILIGDIDPQEYLDPFLGTLMKDPVLLTTSNRVVDRSVALQSILRGGRDPFNGKKLQSSMLQPMPELLETIMLWRKKKETRDYSLGIHEVKNLIDETTVDPQLLQALLDAEKLSLDAKRVEQEALKSTTATSQRWNANQPDNTTPANDDPVNEIEGDMWQTVGLHDNENNENVDTVVANPTSIDQISSIDHLIDGKSKTAEIPKVIDMNKEKANVSMNLPGSGVRTFQFMSVHDGPATQQDVYYECSKEMVTATLNGFNSSILCYGQTGSGKTHTFFGPDETLYQEWTGEIPISAGIVLRASMEILEAKKMFAIRGINLVVSAQFIEIYDEQITDLLAQTEQNQFLSIRRETGEIVGATEVAINDHESLLAALRLGHSRKRFAETAMNERSSRSHTAFIIQICQTNKSVADYLIKSKLHLIDLAGSERVKKSGAIGLRLREAVGINYSLLVLGKVIANLVNGLSHVPYFESKLTTMLKGAFGGNCRTCAIVNCRLEDKYGDETLQSLRFGERCSMISNSIKAAASSLASTVETINKVIATIEQQLEGLESKGRGHLESCMRLKNSLDHMKRKRDLLVKDDITSHRK